LFPTNVSAATRRELIAVKLFAYWDLVSTTHTPTPVTYVLKLILPNDSPSTFDVPYKWYCYRCHNEHIAIAGLIDVIDVNATVC
jgi:hypothetical protein